MNDFQERVIAAQELRDECAEYGIRLCVNGDGSISLFHGTSAEAADKIINEGFSAGTYFSHAKGVTGYGDEGPDWYASVKNPGGRIIEIKVDARCVEFVSSTGEFYCPNAIKRNIENNLWCEADSFNKAPCLEELIDDASKRSEEFCNNSSSKEEFVKE